MKLFQYPNFLICVTLLFFFSSCDKDPIIDLPDNGEGEVDPFTILFTKVGSPWLIDEELEIPEDYTLRIEAGAEVIVGDDVYIQAFGDVYIEGTEDEPVRIKGQSQVPGWGQLKVKGSASNFVIRHAIIEDGTLTSFDTKNVFNNVQFINKQNLDWEWAIARFWYGSVLIENCHTEGINKVEGFLLHDVHNAVIQNNYFERIPDAVELLKCKNGQILNNTIRNCSDDAIDLNACTNILIANNDIKNISNAGMEIGSENLGRSTEVIVENNRVENCGIGIYLKESSEGIFQNDSIISCQAGFDLSTPADSVFVSDALIKQCYFMDNNQNIVKDERSIVVIED